MRLYVLAAAAALLVGCASAPSVFNAPSQTYRAKGSDKLATISSRIERSGASSHRLVVDIDGTPAIDGNLGQGTADLAGQYQGKPAQALCNRKDTYAWVGFQKQLVRYSVTCRIIIDGEFVSTVTID